mmetsp:Transcript_4507/g.12584  ORF Transcript_4507/g.12584 Transcript_4507/m.12584 type:complete len:333 (+) Transcript_4507:134-1132(+)|eukprot:CAMPEP_0117652358 /NCGR_PEP_ID=MMETSP0804-20121206/2584_1 /TAXON_ID=1074897 /ORGANISM="Tetraselmis astigmatica, Strain CCMP880" /LENGTH=332 /DNA_ID=CAMNT_0005458399 /DNA_START=105 /DNA_END=1103 /DNA_ORIENTATION=-
MGRPTLRDLSLPAATQLPAPSTSAREGRGQDVRHPDGELRAVLAAASKRNAQSSLCFPTRWNRSVVDGSSAVLPESAAAAGPTQAPLQRPSGGTSRTEPFPAPSGEINGASSAPAGSAAEDIFEIEVDDDTPGGLAHGSTYKVDSSILSRLAADIAFAANAAVSSRDRKLRIEVMDALKGHDKRLPHCKLLQKVAASLCSHGHDVEIRTSLGGYTPSTSHFNLKHSYLLCTPRSGMCIGCSPLIVDLSFKDQFGIACPSPTYTKLLECVPDVFVGSAQSLQAIVDTLGSQITESFQMHAMPTPPWRRVQALYSKWFPVKTGSSKPLCKLCEG